jgi:hypothetical protein
MSRLSCFIRRRRRMGAKLGCGRARVGSLPPCGGGLGGGVVPWGTELPHLTTPTPDPSPQGGGEKFAAPSCFKLAAVRAGGGGI